MTVFFFIPCACLCLRVRIFDVQQVLSKDSVTVHVDAVVFYRVNSPIMATNNVEDYRSAGVLIRTSKTQKKVSIFCKINASRCHILQLSIITFFFLNRGFQFCRLVFLFFSFTFFPFFFFACVYFRGDKINKFLSKNESFSIAFCIQFILS